MIYASKYISSEILGRDVHDEFIYNYSVDVDLEGKVDLDCEAFTQGLFRGTRNVKVYCRIIENINLYNCPIMVFEALLNQISKNITSDLDDLANAALKFSMDRFISKNKPVSITDLVYVGYNVYVRRGEELIKIESFKVNYNDIELCAGDGEFTYDRVQGKYFDRDLYFNKELIKSYSVDHVSRCIYLEY